MKLAALTLVVVATVACHGHEEVPESFKGMENPLSTTDTAAVAAGESIYSQACTACHGADLRGNGPDAALYSPKPTDLIDHAGHHDDDYLMWKVSEGTGTDMPAFESTLTVEERWQVITFMNQRAGD